jgi:hypothetical protein
MISQESWTEQARETRGGDKGKMFTGKISKTYLKS